MLLVKLLMPVIGGFTTHTITKPVIDHHFTPPYTNLTQYGVGYLLIQPFATLFDDHLAEIGSEKDRHLLANLLAGVLFGMGVMIGYLADAVKRDGA